MASRKAEQPQATIQSSRDNDAGDDEKLPKHILDFLKNLRGSKAEDDSDTPGMKTQNLKSAQQLVWMLSDVGDVVTTTSATTTTTSERSTTTDANDSFLPSKWKLALQLGNNRIIVRQWKASSCWWNLNRNQQPLQGSPAGSPKTNDDDVKIMARSEIAGYRIARQALSSSNLKIHIPVVLHFSLDDDNHNNKESAEEQPLQPWAILAYVGPNSTIFNDKIRPDTSWMDGMVKTRFEFGFHEPHPRWGRVPEKDCVDYTLVVLREVIMPLHRYHQDAMTALSIPTSALRKPTSANDKSAGFTYASMVGLYDREQEKMGQSLAGSSSNDRKLEAANEVLKKAIIKLKDQQPYSDQPLKPLVLCHMDCQPQNLLFARGQSNNNNTNNNDTEAHVASVFDWEEAALADRRFELLLLCRKVCSNRDQAEQVWITYGEELGDKNNLGPLQPWLALETVHSITSLLLQSMDLLGGGRRPWESKPDLWGKIQREIRRLVVEYSWDFADIPEFQ